MGEAAVARRAGGTEGPRPPVDLRSPSGAGSRPVFPPGGPSDLDLRDGRRRRAGPGNPPAVGAAARAREAGHWLSSAVWIATLCRLGAAARSRRGRPARGARGAPPVARARGVAISVGAGATPPLQARGLQPYGRWGSLGSTAVRQLDRRPGAGPGGGRSLRAALGPGAVRVARDLAALGRARAGGGPGVRARRRRGVGAPPRAPAARRPPAHLRGGPGGRPAGVDGRPHRPRAGRPRALPARRAGGPRALDPARGGCARRLVSRTHRT